MAEWGSLAVLATTRVNQNDPHSSLQMLDPPASLSWDVSRQKQGMDTYMFFVAVRPPLSEAESPILPTPKFPGKASFQGGISHFV